MNPSVICENCGKIYTGKFCPECGAINRDYDDGITQDFENKKDKRNEINENYGFTYQELIKIYHAEAKQADEVYKSFVTGGISRLDKINGRFLTAQLIKLDILSQQNNRIIHQNDEIIELLKKIAEK